MRQVVFIDDEENICDIYKILFSSAFVNPITFTDAEEAISYLNDNKADLCFIDFRMKKMDGIQCRKSISSNIPCYLLTGENDFPEHSEVNNLFIQILPKPLSEEHLLTILDNH